MSREIKFRGMSLGGNPEWVYGSFVDDLDAWICDHKIPSDPELPLVLVNKKTVGQFTGLKDKHGKEIYEGDILKARYAPRYELNTFEIKWHEGSASFVCYRNHPNHAVQFEQLPLCPSNSMEDLEIIGNIYQTPELLTDKTLAK